MKSHVCKPCLTCRCVGCGDSPNPDCPIHGDGPDYGRCGDCGRFIPRKKA